MAEKVKDLYSVLGVARHAPQNVIKAAYRALAKQYHPDGDSTGNPERFIELTEAYDVLSDDSSRAAYDETLLSQSSAEVGATRDRNDRSLDSDEIWSAKISLRPEIGSIYMQLTMYSTALGHRFRNAVIEGKCDEDPLGFAVDLDKAFFLKYFGNNPDHNLLARKLLEAGHRRAARILSRAVRRGKLSNQQQSIRWLEIFRRLLDSQLERNPETKTTEDQRHPYRLLKRRAFTLSHFMRFLIQA
jgi:curved DNA-binding protein CbpA